MAKVTKSAEDVLRERQAENKANNQVTVPNVEEPKAILSPEEQEKADMKAQVMKELRDEIKGELLEEMKKDVKQEMIEDMDAITVQFYPTIVEGSEETAKKLNNQEYRICVWDLEEGVPKGFREEVKINGAVAVVPRGITLYAPISVAVMIGKYRKAEDNPDVGISNKSGGVGVRADRDEKAKKFLGME